MSREQSLDEWVCQLPSEHRAFQEYAELKAKVSRLEQHQRDVMSDYEAVHQELDRLGAPRRQDNGFGYLPLGRLRKLSVNECGEGLKDALMSERNAAEKGLAEARAGAEREQELTGILTGGTRGIDPKDRARWLLTVNINHSWAINRLRILADMCDPAQPHVGDLPGHDWLCKTIREIQSKMETAATECGQPPTCAWTEDRDGAWETECGGIWEFPDGGPSENGARYCCRCGREIEATGYAELQAEKGGG